jgi:hypothetical protein
VLTGKLVLVIFLIVDTAYVAQIMRREAHALRRRMPRWRGPGLAYTECAAITTSPDAHVMRGRFHALLERLLDAHRAHQASHAKPSNSRHPH